MMMFFKMSLKTFAILALFFIQIPLAQAIEWDPRLTRGRLDNGLSYIIYDSKQPSDPFNIRLIVRAGSIDEEKPSGIAHILEHMSFQSTEAHPDNIHRYVQEIGWKTGLQLNAVTRETETQFMIRTRPDDALDIDGSLSLMADIAFGPKLLDKDWQQEKLVILEELRQGDDVVSRISRQKKEILRHGSRYTDRPTIGTVDGITQTTVEEIRDFHQKFYVPSNMTLVISGRVDAGETSRMIARYFGPEPFKPAPYRGYVSLPLEDGVKVGMVQDPKGSSSQVTYALRLKMPDRATPEGQFVYLQNYFLTRMIREEIERYGRHYPDRAETWSFVAQETTPENLILAFNARTKKHDEAWGVLLANVERLRRNGLSKSSFDQNMEKVLRINRENPKASESRTYAEWEDKITSAVLEGSVLEEPQTRALRIKSMLARMTLDGLNARLREMLSARDRILFYQLAGGAVAQLPSDADVEAEEERLASTERLPELPPINSPQPSVVTATVPVLPQDLTLRSGSITSETVKAAPDISEIVLSNGDRVVWLNRETPDHKIYISAQSFPGYMNAEYNSVLSQAAVQLWNQSGFDFWTQDEYDQWNKEKKTRWSWVLKKGVLDVAVAASADELPQLLQDYALSVVHGAVREEAMEAFQENYAASPHSETFTQFLYGSEADVLTPDLVKQMTIEDFQKAGKSFMRAPVTWFAVGPRLNDDIRNAFSRNIAGIERQAPLTSQPAMQKHGINSVEVKTLDGDRASVRLAFFAPMNWTPEGAFMASALTPIAKEALKNRLRLELGGVYSVNFELDLDPDTNRVTGTLSFNCAPSRVNELTEAALAVLRDMPKNAGQVHQNRIQDDIKFAEQGRLQDANTWLRRLALSYRRYGNGGYLLRMQSLPDKVTRQLLVQYAQQIFTMSDFALMKELPRS